MKDCNRCKKTLELNKFVKCKKAKDGYNGMCRRCHSEMPSFCFSNLKKSAIRRGVEVKITLIDYKKILSDNNHSCNYCGDSIKGSTGGSLDRVDNSIGYTIKNVIVCCGICNTMKSCMSSSEFLTHVNKIYIKNII